MEQIIAIASMFAIGLMGAGHCIGMCGGIATGLGFATQKHGGLLVIGYNLGRISSYMIAGVVVASAGYWGHSYLALGPWLRLLAGILLIFMGLYLAGWSTLLTRLEQVGNILWKQLQPLSKKLLPVTTLRSALLLGMLWGWLPCGLVYSALAYAATASTPAQGGLLMVAFGIGTAPAMLLGGFFSARVTRFVQSTWPRRAMALVLIGFGVWTVVSSSLRAFHGMPMH